MSIIETVSKITPRRFEKKNTKSVLSAFVYGVWNDLDKCTDEEFKKSLQERLMCMI